METSLNSAPPVNIRDYDDLPGPRGLPFFGNALQLDLPRLHQQFVQWSHEYGSLFKLTLSGRRMLVVADHDMVAGVLRDRPDAFWRTKKMEEIWVELGLPVGLFAATGDVRVPRNTIVLFVMRRDSVSESHVPNAAAFEPERWLAGGDTASTAANSAKRISMPFGAGPRICPGRYLALLEMKLAIATILRDFDITSVDTEDGSPAQEVMKFAMAPEGLRMKLRAKAHEATTH